MACLHQHSLTFWSVTQSLLVIDCATIPHWKEEAEGFQMTSIASKNLVKEACKMKSLIPSVEALVN